MHSAYEDSASPLALVGVISTGTVQAVYSRAESANSIAGIHDAVKRAAGNQKGAQTRPAIPSCLPARSDHHREPPLACRGGGLGLLRLEVHRHELRLAHDNGTIVSFRHLRDALEKWTITQDTPD